jgi:hypothetical protein
MSTNERARISNNQVIRPVPYGEHSVTAYLTANTASKAIDFYKRAFNAEELFRETVPDGGRYSTQGSRLAIPLSGYQMNFLVPLIEPLQRWAQPQ